MDDQINTVNREPKFFKLRLFFSLPRLYVASFEDQKSKNKGTLTTWVMAKHRWEAIEYIGDIENQDGMNVISPMVDQSFILLTWHFIITLFHA